MISTSLSHTPGTLQSFDISYEVYKQSRSIDSGAIVKLTQDEILGYTGPVHYVPHFAVINPSSKSTKLRVVSDSAFLNRQSGRSLNDLIKSLASITLFWK